MVKKSTENGYSVPPFLLKCYEMVDDPSTDAVISWGPTGDSFVVLNETEFTSELLPKYFKHSNFSSFQRQLNIYGFRKTDTDRWEFANDGFIKDQKHMLKYIIRRKPSQVAVQQKPLAMETNTKRKDVETQKQEDKNGRLWKEVECLTTDKNMLMQELAKLRQHQETSQTKLLLVREQLKGMEKHQQQMLSFIVMAMQSPDFLVQFLQPKENNWRIVTEDCEEVVPSNGTIVRYQRPPEDSSQLLHPTTSNSEDSFELHKDFFKNIDFMLGRPYDEKLLSPKNHDPLVLPYLPDSDSMLDQLLSSSPTLEDNYSDSMLDRLLSSTPTLEEDKNTELDDEDFVDTGMEMDPTSYGTQQVESDGFKFLVEGFEKAVNMRTDTSMLETGLVDSSSDGNFNRTEGSFSF